MAIGKSAAIFSVSGRFSVPDGQRETLILTYFHNSDLCASYKGIATTTGSVDAFNFSEGGHEEEQGRRTVGQSSIEPIGVINTTGMDKFDTTTVTLSAQDTPTAPPSSPSLQDPIAATTR